jgi:hypothetical protein
MVGLPPKIVLTVQPTSSALTQYRRKPSDGGASRASAIDAAAVRAYGDGGVDAVGTTREERA